MNIQLEPHVLTPYFYPQLNVTATTCSEEEDSNYREYNLFCLKTRLRPFLEKRNLSKLTIEFIPVQRGSRIYIGLRLVDAGERVTLSPKDQHALEEKVKEITTVNRTYCLLYSSDADIYLDERFCRQKIPSYWILSLLPYLPIDPVINPYLDDGYLYVDLSIYLDYDVKYQELYAEIERHLKQLYRQGAIVCNSTFAQQWQLKAQTLLGYSIITNEAELLEDETTSDLTDDTGVYIPIWSDARFAPDRVTFLLSRMADEKYLTLYLHVRSTFQQETITNYFSKKGRKKEFFFHGEDLIVLEIRDIVELQELINDLTTLPIEEKTLPSPTFSVNLIG